jgi:aminocarboxymuconate-semialdehyde decarboxylase
VLLGSDYPYPLGEAEAGALIRTSPLLTDAERVQLLADNAAAYLGTGVPV